MFGFIKNLFGWGRSMQDEILIKMLQLIDIFKTMSESELYELSRRFKLKKYTYDNVVVNEWEQPSMVWVVQSWLLVATVIKNWQTVILWEIWNWSIYAEMSYFNKTKAMATLVASKDTVAWEIPINELDSFFKRYPHLKDYMHKVMQRRIQDNTDKLTNW